MSDSSHLTPAQLAAIEERGQLLVVAGAGAGKTSTLVERCFARLTDPRNPVSPEQMLLVTFTKAAAAEMRQRLRARLEKARNESSQPGQLAETIALLDSARISTLHQFCLELVRENFDRLDLDPRLTALEEDQRRTLMERILDDLFEVHYAKKDGVAELVGDWAGGREKLIREWVRKLHDYSQTLRRPEEWLAGQESFFQNPAAEIWEKWWLEGTVEWAKEWRPRATALPRSPGVENLEQALLELEAAASRAAATEPLLAILALFDVKETKKSVKALKNLEEETAFLASLRTQEGADPLQEDWDWSRAPMLALLALTRAFGAEFARVKRESGVLDFHDMEQFALRLLWNDDHTAVSPLAESWRTRLEMISVDEYQDINEAQDAILQALSREGKLANRFLVGDVKQSIYRFRLADPRIFLRYQNNWSHGGEGRVVYLSDNFRSHESILNFVNAVFRLVMNRRIGGIDYAPEVELRFGNAAGRPEHGIIPGDKPRVELLLQKREKKGDQPREEAGDDDEAGAEPATGIEAEALMIGRRLRALREEQLPVGKEGRRAEWRDMVILLRAPAEKRMVFLKVFHQLGIPLETSRSGVMESTEVLDLESLLRILDNPWQDLPLLAVLRSPFGGFTPEDLLRIRLENQMGNFWPALQTYRFKGHDAALRDRVGQFLDLHEKWRARSKQEPLSFCLESILEEAFYREWIEAGDRVIERLANVREFVRMTRDFDLFQREGLFRFIRYVDQQREIDAGIESPFFGDTNAVRLLSIHQSKGLEFPVVVVADLGKNFNLEELKSEIVLDEKMGLCPMTHPPRGARPYPSLALWSGRRSQRRTAQGEELRLLYVAMTRASERLILSGTASAKRIEEQWGERAKLGTPSVWVELATTPLDWIGCWLVEHLGVEAIPASGQNALLSWRIVEPSEALESASDVVGQSRPIGRAMSGETIVTTETSPAPDDPVVAVDLNYKKIHDLEQRLSWTYPSPAAQVEPAKTSVTAMRRRLAEEDEESSPAQFLVQRESGQASSEVGGLTPAEAGIAHHLFLQWSRIDGLAMVAACVEESRRLVRSGVLSEAEAAILDLESVVCFWQSKLGRRIVENRPWVQREMAFTARFEPAELAELGAAPARPGLEGEFVVVQGVVDLAVILKTEIWLVDFKTDRAPPGELAEKVAKYQPQTLTYARALEKAYRRPVTEVYLHFLNPRKTARIR